MHNNRITQIFPKLCPKFIVAITTILRPESIAIFLTLKETPKMVTNDSEKDHKLSRNLSSSIVTNLNECYIEQILRYLQIRTLLQQQKICGADQMLNGLLRSNGWTFE